MSFLLTMEPTDLSVTIIHNTARYGGPPSLEQVFACWADADPETTHNDILNAAFNEFNIGEVSAVAKAYRGKHLRSLSVGDVVVVGQVAYVCRPVGWDAYPLPLFNHVTT